MERISAAMAMHCPGCFQEKGSVALCPHCGYDESHARSPLLLPYRTLLHGKYVVGRVLGEPGGFGITYLVYHAGLAVRMAIKEYLPRECAGRSHDAVTIQPHSHSDEQLFLFGLGQFMQEARLVAQFHHAGLVRVHDYFEENGTGYLVMDYYQGMSLDAWLKRQPGGRVNESLARGIMLPILDGLREVHGKGILHRDIKPANIYLADLKRPILLDFGAARVAMGERSRSLSVVLTPGYAPYEQYHRKGVQGPWTDVYGCAAVLYRMVAGFAPPEAAERIVEDELQALASVVPGGSAGFSAAVQQGLSMQQADRPQSVEEFQHLLEGVGPRPRQAEQRTAEDRPEPEPEGDARKKEKAPAPSGKAPSFILLALIVCLLAAGLGVFAYSSYQGQVEEQAASRQAEKKRQEALAAQRLAEEQRLAAVRAAEEQRRQEAAARLAEAERLKKEGPYGREYQDPVTGMEFVWVPPGSFDMGDTFGEGKSDEQPVHRVTLEGFYLGKYEVTQGEWKRVMGSNPSRYQKGPRYPVESVSWHEVDDFIGKLNKKSSKRYALPSEAQWEYAASWRADGKKARFGTGEDTIGPDEANFDGRESGKQSYSRAGAYRKATVAVDSFSANGLGLYNMSGNVREWVEDCWHENHQGAPADGSAWKSGDCTARVFRGGSWFNGPGNLRSAHRARIARGIASRDLGFRLVLPVHRQ